MGKFDPSDSQEAWTQLESLTRVSDTTGIVHEAQVLQLKIWPALGMPHAWDYTVTVDQNNKIVDIRYLIDESVTPPVREDQANLWAGLARSVLTMLGQSWTMRLYVEGHLEPIYVCTGRNVQPPAPAILKGDVPASENPPTTDPHAG